MCSVSRHFFYPFSVYDGGLSLSKSVRNPTNAYESARKLPSLAINHNGLLFRFERDVVKSHGLLKTLRCVTDIAI